MTSSHSDQLDSTLAATEAHRDSIGRTIAEGMSDALESFVLWIMYFHTAKESETAAELLEGAHGAALEAVAYGYLGLGRATISAIRQQVELVTAYAYFRDHPVEWDKVGRAGDGFAMYSFVESYQRETDRSLGMRLDFLEQRAPPSLRQAYRLLSAHVHGQSRFTVPKHNELLSVVLPPNIMSEMVDLQRSVATSLSNFLVAVYAKNWPELPQSAVSNVASALKLKQRPLFFADW